MRGRIHHFQVHTLGLHQANAEFPQKNLERR